MNRSYYDVSSKLSGHRYKLATKPMSFSIVSVTHLQCRPHPPPMRHRHIARY